MSLEPIDKCTTRMEAVNSLLGRLREVPDKPQRVFGLPFGGAQEEVLFVQALTVGVPSLQGGVNVSIEDGYIGLRRHSCWMTYLVPIPEGEDLYCGYGREAVNDLVHRLEAKGYLSTVGRAPVRGFGPYVSPAQARRALLLCLDKYPRLRSWVKCNHTELFELVRAFGKSRHPQTMGEKRLVKVLLEEAFGSNLGSLNHVQGDPLLYSRVYALNRVYPDTSTVVTIGMPQWMFDLNVRLVESGGLPLVPSWVGYGHHQYNGELTSGGCTGGFPPPAVRGLSRPNLFLQRVLLPLLGTFTTELSSRTYNGTDMCPSREWEDRFRAVAENLLKGEFPRREFSTNLDWSAEVSAIRYATMVSSTVLAAAREIPIILREKTGELRYIQASRISNEVGELTMDLHYWPNGDPCILPMPKPTPKPKVKPLPLSPEARPIPQAQPMPRGLVGNLPEATPGVSLQNEGMPF